jgi:hypothetical protein
MSHLVKTCNFHITYSTVHLYHHNSACRREERESVIPKPLSASPRICAAVRNSNQRNQLKNKSKEDRVGKGDSQDIC